MLISDTLSATVDHFPFKEALICNGRRMTYSEIADATDRLSSFLVNSGLRKGDRVLIYMGNTVEAVLSIYGTLKASGVFVVINPQVKSHKLNYIIRDSGARFLVSDKVLLPVLNDALRDLEEPPRMIISGDGKSKEEGELELKYHTFEEAVSTGVISRNPSPIDVDLAALIYTSGSTGSPKGVMLTHRNMVSASNSIIKYLRNTPDDIILSVLPLSFDYGLYQIIMAFHFGGTVVLEPSFVFPHLILSKISSEKATGFPIVPTICSILLRMKNLEDYDLSSLRYITNTAQQLPPTMITRLVDEFPDVDIYSMYGLTECKRVSYLPPELLRSKPGSVGKAMPNVEAFILGEDGEVITTPWTRGELMIRGSNVMQGYWNDVLMTGRVLKVGAYPDDRFLLTGDIFEMDDDGDLYFIGRKDDIIKTRGEKVSPKEVENVIYQMEGIKDVGVIGVDDELLGQAVKAFISSDDIEITAEVVQAHCQRNMESFMVPKYFVILKELPKNQNGKIDKLRLSNEQ